MMQTAVRSWQPECDDVCSMGFSLLSWEAAWAVQSVRGRKQPFGSVAGSPNLARQVRVSESTKLGVRVRMLVCRMCRRVQCSANVTARPPIARSSSPPAGRNAQVQRAKAECESVLGTNTLRSIGPSVCLLLVQLMTLSGRHGKS